MKKYSILFILMLMLSLGFTSKANALTQEEYEDLNISGSAYIIGDYVFDLNNYNPTLHDIMVAARTIKTDEIEILRVQVRNGQARYTKVFANEIVSGFPDIDVVYFVTSMDGIDMEKMNISQYVVSLYDGNDKLNDVLVTKATPMPIPATPLKTGYTFNRWLLPNDTPYNFNADVISDMRLYASWNINSYDLVFRNGVDTINTTSYQYGAPITAYADPEPPSNYDFDGWYLEDDDLPYVFSTMPANDLTLHARFAEKTYTVRLYDDFYSANYEDVELKLSESKDITNPIQEGRIFEGWYTSEIQGYHVTETINSTTDWLSLSGETIEPGSITLETYALLSSTGKQKCQPNMDFASYYSLRVCGEEPNCNPNTITFTGLSSTPGEIVELYAMWEELPYVRLYGYGYYCLTDSETGDCQEDERGNYIYDTSSTAPIDKYLYTTTNGYVNVTTIRDYETVLQTRKGYTFDGWHAFAYDSDECVETNDHYCIFEEHSTYKVEKANFNFATTPISSNIKVMAKFNPIQYSISFNLNGGTDVTYNPVNVYSGAQATLPNGDDIVLPNNAISFLGWTLKGDIPYEDQLLPFTLNSYDFATDIELFATYEFSQITINFHNNDGSETVTSETLIRNGYVDESFILKATAGNVQDKTLIGWGLTPDKEDYLGIYDAVLFLPGTGLYSSFLDMITSPTLDFYAIYENTQRNVKYYNYSSGTPVEILSHNGATTNSINDDLQLPLNIGANPSGMVFAGWLLIDYYQEAHYFDAGSTIEDFDFIIVGDNIEFRAVYFRDWYSPNQSSFTFDNQDDMVDLLRFMYYSNLADKSVQVTLSGDLTLAMPRYETNELYGLVIGANQSLIIPNGSTLDFNDINMDVKGTLRIYKNSNGLNIDNYYINFAKDGMLIATTPLGDEIIVGSGGTFKLEPESTIILTQQNDGTYFYINGAASINQDITIDTNDMIDTWGGMNLSINADVILKGNIIDNCNWGSTPGDESNESPCDSSTINITSNGSLTLQDNAFISEEIEVTGTITDQRTGVVISYDSNGGIDMGILPTRVQLNSPYTIFAYEPMHSNMSLHFVGWALSPDGEAVYSSGEPIAAASQLSNVENSAVTLYAIWAE